MLKPSNKNLQIINFINLSFYSAEEIEKPDSEVRKFIILYIMEIVLKNVSSKELETFNNLVETNPEKASSWILDKAYPLKDKIRNELENIFLGFKRTTFDQ